MRFRHVNRLHITRFIGTILRGGTTNKENVVSSDPESPQIFVKSAHVQIPQQKAPSDVFPRGPVAMVIEFEEEHVGLVSCVRNEIRGVGTWSFVMVENLSLTEVRKRTMLILVSWYCLCI